MNVCMEEDNKHCLTYFCGELPYRYGEKTLNPDPKFW